MALRKLVPLPGPLVVSLIRRLKSELVPFVRNIPSRSRHEAGRDRESERCHEEGEISGDTLPGAPLLKI